MVSFFSHGFASGGTTTKKGKKGKKEEKGEWKPIVDDSSGQIVNWQHRETKAYYYAPPMQPMVMIPVVPQQAHPVAPPMLQPAMPRAVHVMPPPPVKENKDKENKRDCWESFRDEKGGRYYKNLRTDEIRYDDPLR